METVVKVIGQEFFFKKKKLKVIRISRNCEFLVKTRNIRATYDKTNEKSTIKSFFSDKMMHVFFAAILQEIVTNKLTKISRFKISLVNV